MRWRVYLIGILAWILTVPFSLSRADQSLQSRYLDIYLKMNDAYHLEKQGDFRGALDDYKDCYDKLAKIQEEDPDWEKALVGHRMEDCKAKILYLQPEADAQASTPPASSETNAPSIQPSLVPSDETLDDVPSLKKRLNEVEAELQTTKQNLADSQNQVEAYRSQLEVVNQELAGLKNQQSVNDKVGRLLSENKDLTDKLATAQKELDALKSVDPKSRLSLVQAQLKNLQEQFDASQAANQALQETTDTLKQKLDEVEADLVTANQKLAAAPAASPEYETLKRENEIMRDILTRELQEQAHRDMAKRLAQEEFDNLKLKSKVLQEQLDILGSPMTPPTNDQERDLLASLKGPGMDVTQPPSDSGNVLSAPAGTDPTMADPTTNAVPQASANPSTSDTNMASATPAATNSAPATDTAANMPPSAVSTSTDNSTNQPPVTVASGTPAATPSTVTDTTTPSTPAPATNGTSDVSDTNSMASTPAPSPSTTADAGAPSPSSSSTPDAGTSTPTPPATTNAPDVGSSPLPPSPTAVSTSPTETTASPSATPPSSAPDSDTQTKSVIPPGTTTYTDTTIQNGANAPQQNDPTEYSTKARLPDDMRDTAQQAADLFKNQRYDESAAKYQTIIDKYPESLYAWSNLGVVRFQQGNLNDALKALQQAVKLSPTDAFSYSNLGIVYYQLNEYENAIDALNAAKALDPNDAKTRNYLGCACSQKGWQEVAEKEFRKAIELDPNFGDAHFNLALVYATSKPPSLELARREYNRALELGIAKDARLEKLLQP